ncbi:MAG: serine O-acetyltransferase [Myxococcales bacterium]|nr:serine O-acetyltransferase [Myxococcales bacterium]MCB9532574.1 serine O-acetyltransferase [Myxococcales bacterium]MCB9533800.1 serine O-acetyltransferase [Myxococcales bacterium]
MSERGTSRWQTAVRRLRAFSDRPAGEPSGTAARVAATPPSPPPATLFEFVARAREDVDAVLAHDPAARTALEVLLVYPGLHAIWAHRVAHVLWRRGHVITPRVIAHFSRGLTGVEIHPGARVGRRVFIDHGMGIVIGETAAVGDECLLYKGVVLGGTSLARTERHPTLGRGVVVGTNACILGPIHVGDGAKIGSNSVVVRDVPEGATAVGVPGKVAAAPHDSRARLMHAHGDLPDPVASVLQALVDEVETLRRRLAALEGEGGLAGRDGEMDRFEGSGS